MTWSPPPWWNVPRRERVRVLAADPPWQYEDDLPGATRGAARQYNTLDVDALLRFPLPPLATDAWLALWYTTAFVDEARAVARAWGFEPSGGELVWIKTTRLGAYVEDPDMRRCAPLEVPDEIADVIAPLAFGMGRATRNCDERVLLARRGRPRRFSRSVRSVFFAPQPRHPTTRKVWHSAKPDQFYAIAERLLGPGPRAELFARRRRPGWTPYGDQVPDA